MTPSCSESVERQERETLLAVGAILPDGIGYDLLNTGEFAAVAAALGSLFPRVVPSPAVKHRLLERIGTSSADCRAADRAALAALPGFTFRFTEDGAFVPTRYPGLSVRLLHVDSVRQQFSAMIKLEPKASYPSHSHEGAEECLVLEGELFVGGVRMRAGDYQRAEPGTVHVEQSTVTGALLYITAPLGLLKA